MTFKKNGQATYLENENYYELFSYESRICRVFKDENIITFYKDYDFSRTTTKHITQWFDYLGIEEMATPKQREKAINNGEIEINGIKYVVEIYGKGE